MCPDPKHAESCSLSARSLSLLSPALYPPTVLLGWGGLPSVQSEWMDPACERAELQIIQGQGCQECKSPLRRGGRREERRRNKRKTRQPKTRHGKEAKLWRLEGGGLGFAAPARASPQNVPFLVSRPVNHCHLNSTLSPNPSRLPLPSGQPKATPVLPEASQAPEPPAPLPTPPSRAPFLHFPPPLHPSSRSPAPPTQAPIHRDLAPSAPLPSHTG